MKVAVIKKSFWIPKDDNVFIKCSGMGNNDECLTKINIRDTLLDNYEPKQIFYILDQHPKLVFEFMPTTYIEIERLLKK